MRSIERGVASHISLHFLISILEREETIDGQAECMSPHMTKLIKVNN